MHFILDAGKFKETGDRGGGALKYLHDVEIEASRDSSLTAVQILRALFLSEWKSWRHHSPAEKRALDVQRKVFTGVTWCKYCLKKIWEGKGN